MNRDDELGIYVPRKPCLSMFDRFFIALAEHRILAPAPLERIGWQHLWKRYKPAYRRFPSVIVRHDWSSFTGAPRPTKDIVAHYAREAEDIRMGALK